MRWGKVVLFFQAGITLIIGLVFLSSVLSANSTKEVESGEMIEMKTVSEEISLLKSKYMTAAYILTTISLIEIIIIYRLLS